MTRLYLIRHRETQWNTEGRLQGRMDSPLTVTGLSKRWHPSVTGNCDVRCLHRDNEQGMRIERYNGLTDGSHYQQPTILSSD